MPFKDKEHRVSREYKVIEKEIMEKATKKDDAQKKKPYFDIVTEIIDEFLNSDTLDISEYASELMNKYDINLKK